MTELETLERSDRWPYRVLLPLAHRTKTDGGWPLCAVLALGHGTRVYFANLNNFDRSELQSKAAFNAALERFESVHYMSLTAILADWRVD